MILVSSLWPGLLGALALGACIGAVAGFPRDRFGLAAAAAVFATLAILAGLAILRTVPGQGGLWIETAALTLAAYLAGCLAGSVGRRGARRG